jgi:hypothetical protein
VRWWGQGVASTRLGALVDAARSCCGLRRRRSGEEPWPWSPSVTCARGSVACSSCRLEHLQRGRERGVSRSKYVSAECRAPVLWRGEVVCVSVTSLLGCMGAVRGLRSTSVYAAWCPQRVSNWLRFHSAVRHQCKWSTEVQKVEEQSQRAVVLVHPADPAALAKSSRAGNSAGDRALTQKRSRAYADASQMAGGTRWLACQHEVAAGATQELVDRIPG